MHAFVLETEVIQSCRLVFVGPDVGGLPFEFSSARESFPVFFFSEPVSDSSLNFQSKCNGCE